MVYILVTGNTGYRFRSLKSVQSVHNSFEFSFRNFSVRSHNFILESSVAALSDFFVHQTLFEIKEFFRKFHNFFICNFSSTATFRHETGRLSLRVPRMPFNVLQRNTVRWAKLQKCCQQLLQLTTYLSYFLFQYLYLKFNSLNLRLAGKSQLNEFSSNHEFHNLRIERHCLANYGE